MICFTQLADDPFLHFYNLWYLQG